MLVSNRSSPSKAVIALMALVVLAVAGLLSAYVWAPAPWSLSSQDKLAQDEYITFNAGTHDDAIRMRYADYERIVHPTLADLVQEA